MGCHTQIVFEHSGVYLNLDRNHVSNRALLDHMRLQDLYSNRTICSTFDANCAVRRFFVPKMVMVLQGSWNKSIMRYFMLSNCIPKCSMNCCKRARQQALLVNFVSPT